MERNRTQGFFRKEKDSSGSALRQLFIYSLAMFTLPVASYFGTIRVFDEYFNIPKSESYIYAVVVAVVVVHIIIIAYIYKAFHDDQDAKKDE